MNNTKISFASKLINNIFNVKILSILLVVTFLLSAIFSSNPRASFFYGDVFDYNVVFFLTMFVLLYVMNNYSNRKSYIFEKKFITIDKAALLWPVFISIICFPLLSITKALPYINWGYMSATGLLTAIIMLFSVFFFLKKWIYKIIASALLIVSMTAFLSGEMAMHLPNTVAQNVSMRILNIFKVNFNEGRPDIATTFEFVKDTFLSNHLLGAGPNQFNTIWQKYRPISLANTQFYNINQDSPSSTFFKILLESGITAIIVLLISIAKIRNLFLEIAEIRAKEIKKFNSDAKLNYLYIALILASLITITFISNNFLFFAYFLVLIYTPSAYSMRVGKSLDSDDSKSGSMIKQSKKNKFARFFLYTVLVFLFMTLLFKYVSYRIIEIAVEKYEIDKDLNAYLSKLDISNRLYPNNFVNGFKSRVYLQQAADLYLNTEKEKRDTVMMDKFKIFMVKAIEEATAAVEKNLNSPYAYEARAGVYEAAMLIDSNTYYAKAKDDYNRAILLDPYNPDHMLGLSRLEYSKGGKESTANLIDRMISIKPNYTPAYLTLADILEVENQREKKAYVLQEAFKADRSNQNVAYLLAQEYYKLGLYSDYKQLMSDLIAINPNLPALKQQMDEALKNIPIKAENKDVVSDKNANTTKDSTNKEESSTKRK